VDHTLDGKGAWFIGLLRVMKALQEWSLENRMCWLNLVSTACIQRKVNH